MIFFCGCMTTPYSSGSGIDATNLAVDAGAGALGAGVTSTQTKDPLIIAGATAGSVAVANAANKIAQEQIKKQGIEKKEEGKTYTVEKFVSVVSSLNYDAAFIHFQENAKDNFDLYTINIILEGKQHKKINKYSILFIKYNLLQI